MSQTPDVRWRQRFQSLQKAFGQLSAAARLAQQRKLSELEQQGLIQAFEFTHELAWNVLKDYLTEQGIVGIVGSKGATRKAFENGLIAEGDDWMAMIGARNRTSHTYNQKTADEIVAAILSSFVPAFEKFASRFRELEASES
jgi:nucleotidyltransferase substrate binding protein (TIGR01987 family)